MGSKYFAVLPTIAACLATMVTGCSATTSAPPDQRLWFAFGLDRNQSDLQAQFDATSTPGGADYAHFQNTGEIANSFGASEAVATAALAKLTAAGLTGTVDPTRGVVTGWMTSEDAEELFGTSFIVQTGTDGGTMIEPQRELVVPESVKSQVAEVAGGRATLPQANSQAPQTASALAAPGALPACPSLATPAPQLRAQVRQLLGLQGVPTSLDGRGTRVALLEIGQYSATSVSLLDKCYQLKVPQVTQQPVNAIPAQLVSSATETTLDLAALGFTAPGIDEASLYQFDRQTSIAFPLAAILASQSNSSTAFDLVSSSVAFCSKAVSKADITMSEWLLMSLGLTGATVVASAGDTGSSSCYPPDQSQRTQFPADSPSVTAIGGTMQAASGDSTSPVVWNMSPSQDQAGGGGPSHITYRPSYQSKLPGTNMRQTPDLAYLADPLQVAPVPVCDVSGDCEFQQVGGTSGSAPAFAGSIALTLQSLRAQRPGQLLGAVNPAVYQLAQGPSNSSVFVDVVDGNNDLFNVGCCVAAPGYDMASGWGTMSNQGFTRAIETLLPPLPGWPVPRLA